MSKFIMVVVQILMIKNTFVFTINIKVKKYLNDRKLSSFNTK